MVTKMLALAALIFLLFSVSLPYVDADMPFQPIAIHSNRELVDFMEENGFSGNGTVEEPYMIKGLVIWSNGLSPCISIENTDLHVVISSCEFHSNISESIHIANSRNIMLEDSAFYGWDGISIYDGENVKIKENTFETESSGMEISSSESIALENNTMARAGNITYRAIHLFLSDDIRMSGNHIEGNSDGRNPIESEHMIGNGIEVETSTNCRISGNHISYTDTAMSFINSETLVIEQNHIAGNYIGIYVNSSSGLFFHNDVMNNTFQASQRGGDFRWDAGYPEGGNHWSDYSGTDERKGPEQDADGKDGIGDEPYVIESGISDRYPLMSSFEDFTAPEYESSEWHAPALFMAGAILLILAVSIIWFRKRKNGEGK